MASRQRLAAPITAALLVGGTAVGACAPASGGAAAGCAAPGLGPNSVKVGLIFPDTGSFTSTLGPARSGVQARVGLANEMGGIHGRRIDLVPHDDGSTEAGNLNAARELIERGSVLGIIEDSASSGGSAAYMEPRDVPVVTIVDESAHRNIFPISRESSGNTAGALALSRYARGLGGTRAYVLQSGTEPSSRTAAADLSARLAAGGVQVVGGSDYALTTDPSSVAAAISRSGADVLASAVSGKELAKVLAALRSSHVSMKAIIAMDGYDAALVAKSGPAMAGVAVAVTSIPFESGSPALKRYREAMIRFAPELSDPDRVTALLGYVTADLFLRGLDAAGPCPTRTGVVNALRAVRDYDSAGLLPGKIDFATSSPGAQTCSFIVRVNAAGTGFEVVDGGGGSGGAQWCG